jgi:hypothetical protein
VHESVAAGEKAEVETLRKRSEIKMVDICILVVHWIRKKKINSNRSMSAVVTGSRENKQW